MDFILTNQTELYIKLISSFYNENINLFNDLKIVRKLPDERVSAFSFIPEDKNEYNIQNDNLIEIITNKFIDEFLIDDSTTFELNYHHKQLEGHKLSDLIKGDSHFSFKVRNRIKLNITIDILELHVFKNYDKEAFKYLKMFFKNTSIIELTESTCQDCNSFTSIYIDLDKKIITTIIDKLDHLEACPIKKTPSNIKVNLKVPSKKLVFLNDPRSLIELHREDKHSVTINSILGIIKEVEMYAKKNIGYFFIGSFSPTIMFKKGEILIAHYDDYCSKDIKKFKDYEQKGSIPIELWWYSVMDYDLFLSLCLKNNISPNSIEHKVVDIQKEECNITHNHNTKKNKFVGSTYSKITF